MNVEYGHFVWDYDKEKQNVLKHGGARFWEEFMKKKIKYTNKFSKEQNINAKFLKDIKDFLPSPEELFPKNEKVKITLEIDVETYQFFQKLANSIDQKYQPLIREILKEYAKKYKNRLAS